MDGRDDRYATTEKVGGVRVEASRRYSGQNHDRRSSWFGRMGMLATAATMLFASSLIAPVAAVDMTHCSSVNTADSRPSVSIYQSNGLCIDACKDDFAFAIVQGSSCWCSDYAPATEEDGGCDESCPGFPSDTCGNSKKELFGYIALNKAPEGTKGSEDDTVSTTSSVQPPPPPSPSTVTTEKQVTTEKDGPTTTVIITASPTKTTDKPKTTSTSSSSSSSSDEEETVTKTTPAPTPQISIITSVGSIQTVTYVPTPTATSEPQTDEDEEGEKKSGISGGAIAGIVIAIVVVLALIAAAIFFWRRRKQKPYDAEGMTVIGAGGAGLIGAGRRRSRSASTLGMLGEKAVSPAATPPGGTADGAVLGAGETAPVETYDQRLDPGTLFMKYDPVTGSSRMSVRSLRDDTDYSRRVLRCANPDDTLDE